MKLNSAGEQQWNTTWGGSGEDEFNSLIVDSSDNILLTGTTDSFGTGGDDIVIIKYSQGVTDTTGTTNATGTTNTTGSPDDPFGLESISGYNLLSLSSGIGLISVIYVKKWRKNAIS